MVAGSIHISQGMSGDTGAPRPTLLKPVSAPCGPDVEHDIDTAIRNAASAPDAPFNAPLFNILCPLRVIRIRSGGL